MHKRRAKALAVIMVLIGAVLLGQLANMQILQAGQYASIATQQQRRSVRTPAPRGEIVDRNGVVMATNRPSNALYVHFPAWKDETLPAKLAALINVDEEEVKKKFATAIEQGRNWEPVRIKGNLTPEENTALVERLNELKGIEVVPEAVREYPQREIASHLIGYVGPINEAELERLGDQGYAHDDILGKSGVELSYERLLKGTPGIRELTVDIALRPIEGSSESTPPRIGGTVQLTIDSELQAHLERQLSWVMWRHRNIINIGDGHAWPNTLAGTAVVMDVKTGEILAMASYPDFDPNVFVAPWSPENDEKLLSYYNNEWSPLWNRALSATYFPGSTWKMVTGTAALEEGVTTPWEQILSTGVYEPTGQKEWTPWGHGWVNAYDALRLSSNIYYYEMGSRLGIEKQVDWAKKFGFGQLTGIDLPYEEEGFLPDAAYREERGEWYLGDTTAAAIGQGQYVTALQLVRYAAAIANGGDLLTPRVVKQVTDADGKVLLKNEPLVTGRVPFSEQTLQVLRTGMELVDSPTGTSDFAQWPLPGLKTAGKTGTAQNPPKDDYGLYVGYAPADDPQIAIAVVLEQAGHGGTVSPVARGFYSKYFDLPLSPGDPAIIPGDYVD